MKFCNLISKLNIYELVLSENHLTRIFKPCHKFAGGNSSTKHSDNLICDDHDNKYPVNCIYG